MATAKTPRTPRAPYYTARQIAALRIAEAILSNAGYEIVDHGNGEVARNLAQRSVEIVDAVTAKAEGAAS